ncbi:chitobiase/beta-hexosaminidase C-terminal domain-containing protein [Flavobacterium algicola]|uniref:chitobiase/beta-hexosaminidase C-terminal domain-containing protein n=1 Tax=Flavobacterium algicola TaxID=556529 RepID=UPI001EFE48A0|nr:chitobiase/beta-hexosaminidase C-terminal domain-containing protein [Flavobacterium algicola]MCG9793700.1 chitobiase/beta-hexosaminidase C-terminal domain-containing protein [Flavobacterium algicola]
MDNGSPIDVEKHFEATNRIAFYGLTRAYIESTEDSGDVTVVASAILGEKKLIRSDKVSIDTQVLALRGTAPKLNSQAYYTLDGSEPTVQSTKFTAPFAVTLGTTVRSLITIDGKPTQFLSERFDLDEGFVWNEDSVQGKIIGDQAEKANYEGVKVASDGEGFNGTGYLVFGKKNKGYVEWYQENDGIKGIFTIKIRYSANSTLRSTYKVLLTVNGKKQEIEIPATAKFKKDWGVLKAKVTFGSGANTVRLTSLEDDGLLIDEIQVD